MITVKNFKSVIQVLDFFRDDKTCKDYLAQQRWGGKPYCPHCGFSKVYVTNRGYKCAGPDCRKKFSVTVKTVFENSKIELRYWFAAIYLITAHKKGISSHQLARDLGVTQKTAWFLNHRIREMLFQKEVSENYVFDGVVQMDEAFVGGKWKNMHGKKRQEKRDLHGGGVGGKQTVFGIISQDKKVITIPVPSRERDVLMPIINKHISKDATIVTDEHNSYDSLSSTFKAHHTVNHNIGEYVSDMSYHTNSIESVWAILKRGYIGIYHYMSPKHINRYCVEFAFRFNNKDITDCSRFEYALSKSAGRLRYKDLIAN